MLILSSYTHYLFLLNEITDGIRKRPIRRNFLFCYGQSLTTKFVVTLLNIFLLEVNFDKSTIRLHFLFISSMLAKFLEN